MRKTIAVILLFTFVAAQYARQVSYLECKLVNYFNPSAVICDCEKLLFPASDSSPFPQPAPHNHIHLDEWYSLTDRHVIIQSVTETQQRWSSVPRPMLMAGFNKAPDRPPQCR